MEAIRALLDVPGPRFLFLYLMMMGLLYAVRPMFKQLARGSTREVTDRVGIGIAPYQLGYLAAGPVGAVRAAVASLAHRGVIYFDGIRCGLASPAVATGRGAAYRGLPNELAREVEHPLDHAIVGRLQRGPATLRQVYRAVRRMPARDTRPLVTDDLILAPSRRWLHTLAANLPLWALIALGAAKIQVEVSRGRPVLLLVGLVTFNVILAVFLRVPWRTPRGDRAVKRLEEDNAALEDTSSFAPEQLTGDEVAVACGLFGGVALGGALAGLGEAMAALPVDRAWTARVATGGGGYTGISSGGGCGSGCGGGGGGGCGGCGGCG